jgi:predicted RNA-binding protein with PUA-like domain
MPKNMPSHFLAKTDPETYSIEDFVKDKVTVWDGVRSHQAVAVIRTWQIGDLVYIYHSMGKACIVGLAKVVSEPTKDLNDTRNTSWHAKLELIETWKESEYIYLKDVKESGLFSDFALVKQSRLSTMKSPQEFVDWIINQRKDCKQ